MTWSALDLVVVLVFVAQLVGWLGVGLAALKIKNGPVTRVTQRTLPLIGQTQSLAKNVADSATRLKARTLILLHRLTSIRKHLNVAESPTGMWIEPQHLQQAAGFLTLLRARSGNTPARRPRLRTTLAQRLGLIPPVLTRLAPLGKVAMVVIQTLKQLRR